MSTKLHYLQHVPFEGLGFIREWADFRRMEISGTRLFAGEHPPSPDEFDWLVVMGGPMSVHDGSEYPWLEQENTLIRNSIEADKTVIGICLGAQLIANALGAKVFSGTHKEIGWFPVRRAAEAPDWFPEEITAFHWHGETFDLPEGAALLASSDACQNQGFLYGDHVIALQFHLESTRNSIEDLIENCTDELTEGPYIQTAMDIRSACPNIVPMNAALSQLLDHLPGRSGT